MAGSTREPEGRVVAEVVREVNDALTAIMGFAGLAQVAPTPHRRRYYLEVLGSQAERVRRLMQTLESHGGAPSALEGAVDLAAELARAFSGSRLALEKQGVAFELMPAAAAVWARCDGRQIGDLVVALVERATKERRRENQANEVTVSVEAAHGRARIVILLAGAERPSALLHEEFGLGELPATMGTSEVELRAGLAAVARMGGQLEVIRDAELEEVRLVLSLPGAPEGRRRDELRTPVPLDLLVIDDDAALGELYPELLAVTGHTVTMATSIAAARELLKGQRFDAVISEFKLRDGLLSELWATADGHPELTSRLIVVTRDARDPRLVEWARESKAPILGKPFAVHALIDQVALIAT